MESFPWDRRFETGLEKVDDQHRHLVAILNRFGAAVVDGASGAESQGEDVLEELARYAEYHFATECALWDATGLDPRHKRAHLGEHDAFLQEVVRLASTAPVSEAQGRQRLLEFLTHWLIFHILGTDQVMAHQIRAIEAGMPPEQAYDLHARMTDGATATLLNSLNMLFRLVSDRNRELFDLNATLEARVSERTQALAEANARLEAMAMTDALTGLPNRRQAMARLEIEWARRHDLAAPLAVMLVDADGFKQINDTYGHDHGDQVLRELSTTMRHAVRTDDLVCRLGGDEFLVICPKTPLTGALHVAELVRQRVAELRVKTGPGEWRGSISIGVAVRDQETGTPEELIKRADEGVYLSKGKGRNCVSTAQPLQEIDV